jgi:hypothetical protein
MRILRNILGLGPELGSLIAAMAVVALASCGTEPEQISQSSDPLAEEAISKIAKHPHKALCAHDTRPGYRHCHARVRTDESGIVPFAAAPSGLTPADLRSAYAIPSSGGSGKTIAIVDAQDDPNAEKDLGTYRSQFGLPACTTANGCFKKVNQNGAASPLPKADKGWAGEIALDIEMASAACPDCKILLVEANSSSDADLMAAEATAAKLGASVISNSWGGSEDSSISTNDSTWFNHPGVAVFVSAGDDGYGAEYPATSGYVTAVGGTSLTKNSSTRGWAEAVWGSAKNTDGGTGSGCSKYVAKPSWQKDTGCSKRTAADVAAVADPNTGVSIYDTYGGTGWGVYGGTSASAPLVAGIWAVTGNSAADASLSYTKSSAFYDITSGTNGSCSGSYLCTAKAGYDGPTGNGTPHASLLGGGGGGGGTCTPSCSGRVCGDDGCGGSCGTCASGKTCSSAGQCVGGTSTCSHDVCATGKKLVSTCDPCVTQVCGSDSYCCGTRWDASCVDEAVSICGASC